jgi:heme a synthase
VPQRLIHCHVEPKPIENRSYLNAPPRLLPAFALLTALLTLGLLGAGGLVTSHGVGMAVPDWPNTFGYNMFFFPISQWVGGVFYEHTHRLWASGVGLCTTILALWLYGRNARRFLLGTGIVLALMTIAALVARPGHASDALVLGLCSAVSFVCSRTWPRCAPAKPWLRRLGVLAFVAVLLQGVLGGLRVVLFKDQIGIFHATLAQLFFALVCVIALVTSNWWAKRFGSPWPTHDPASQTEVATSATTLTPAAQTPSPGLLSLCFAVTLLILAQLILGATMRHQHAGLAIPDFPLAYGKLWPSTTPQAVAHYNQQRIEVVDMKPITGTQIILQMVHRGIALFIFLSVAFTAWRARRETGSSILRRQLTLAWFGLLLAQVLLGAATIWSNKAADIATAHVLVGALSLALGVVLCVLLSAESRLSASPVMLPSTLNHNFAPAFARPSAAHGLD